jgi:uncharacterized membrane protein
MRRPLSSEAWPLPPFTALSRATLAAAIAAPSRAVAVAAERDVSEAALDSVKRKRKRKMNKHRLKKRRRLLRRRTRKPTAE